MGPKTGFAGQTEPQAALLKPHQRLATAGVDRIVQPFHFTAESPELVGIAGA